MSYKKVKTEPCLSPESPFMRKPSKQFLQKLSFNKNKHRQSQLFAKKQALPHIQASEIQKLAFIPVSPTGKLLSKTQIQPNNKLKKTTIELGTFKLKHENMILKTQLQDFKQKNILLSRTNENLIQQNQSLKKQLELKSQSRISKISKFSQETYEQTVVSGQQKRKNKPFNNIVSSGILQINSYNVLPTTMELSRSNSVNFEDEFEGFERLNFPSKSINRKHREQMFSPKNFTKLFSQSLQTQMLSNRVLCLEKQLQSCLERERNLQLQNQSLRLCASMSKRRLEDKDTELKQIKIKEKKKKYFQKLFQLSSQDQF